MQTAFRVFQKSYNQQNTTVVSTLIWTREICRLRDTFYTLTDLISHPVIIIDGISLFTDLMQKCSNKSWEATNNTQRLSTCRVEQCCLIRTAPENLRIYSYQKWSCILQYIISCSKYSAASRRKDTCRATSSHFYYATDRFMFAIQFYGY